MRQPWQIERRRILAALATIVLLGLLSQYWIASIIFPLAAYIGWQMRQLYQLEKWLHKGYKPGKVPDSSGVWESIISEILRLRKQDRKHKKSLAAAAKGYRNTVKALPDAAVVVNQNLEIEWANQLAETLLGIYIKRDTGLRITNLIRTPEFLDYLAKSKGETLEIEAPARAGATLSIRVVQYGKKQRLILGRDISERLKTRDALKGFISNASHELRTPLTVTSGYIDLLQSDPELPENCQAPLQQLREQTDRMTQLISDLLTLSKLEVRPLHPEEGQCIDIEELCSIVQQSLLDAGISQAHTIEFDIAPGLRLRGIEHEISSLITNLLENACKYSPPGTGIKLSWGRNEQDEPCLEVVDQGPGFDPALIPDLTRCFYRINTPSTAHIEGTGLGLAIVKHVMVRHGGSLHIKSQPGAGASFIACFPAFRACDI